MPITPESDLDAKGWTVATKGMIDVLPGAAVPQEVDARGSLDGASGGSVSHSGFELRLQASFDPDLGHYLLREFSVIAPAGEEVTGVLLRAIAPLSVLRWVLPRTFELDRSALTARVANFIAPEMRLLRDPEGNEKKSPVILTDVATVYSLANIVRYPPAKAVAEAFDFPARTASNWIARARAATLI